MNVLITGAGGFVGRNLAENLKNIRDGKDSTRNLEISAVFEYDLDTGTGLLEEYCRKADFVFHLAGVNRAQNPEEFMRGNRDFTETLLNTLRACRNTCPVMLASSVQATLVGRYDSEYGRSKLAGEELLFAYGEETGTRVLVYRVPNLFGKWCRPNYNSVVATFCYNIAREFPVVLNDKDMQVELLYIDDLVGEMLDALEGREHRCEFDGSCAVARDGGRYCVAPVTCKVTLGEIVDLLERFKAQPRSLRMPAIPENSFAKKLYSTYLSYLPEDAVSFPLVMNAGGGGSFTELLRTADHGQFSVNISKPGVTKGQHWHNTKWEFFIVVSGEALIRQRKIGSDEILEFRVSGERMEAVHILPGYTHDITNLSGTHDLVTVMWANESFDPARPDTFFCEV